MRVGPTLALLVALLALWASPAARSQAPAFSLPRYDAASGRYVADIGGRATALTLDPTLQQNMQSILDRGLPQWGAIVVVDTQTGRVLALAEHSQREPGRPGAAFRPIAKAASVFKLITVSALLRAGVDVEKQVCYSGGKTRLQPGDLADHPKKVMRCIRMEDALPLSQNVAVAKLAGRYLTPKLLAEEAERFGVLVPDGESGAEPSPALSGIDMPPSLAIIPQRDLFGFASASAGFGEVRLSALDAARMAAIVGNGGVDIPFTLVDGLAGRATPRRVLAEEQAQMLQGMLTATATRGTAARALHALRAPQVLKGIPWEVAMPVAGKTGSLTDRDVSLDTSWFMGTAPAPAPRIAFAVVIVNAEWIWHVRALEVARAALAVWLEANPQSASPPVVRR